MADNQDILQALLARYVVMMRRAAAAERERDGDDDNSDSDWEDTDDHSEGDQPAEEASQEAAAGAQSLPPPKLEDSDLVAELRGLTRSPLARRGSAFDILKARELGQRHTAYEAAELGSMYLPNSRAGTVAEYDAQVFCGHFNRDGSLFLSGCQDQILRVYDTTSSPWKEIRQIGARDVGWSIIDTDFSPDSRWAVYSSWSNCVHLFNVTGTRDVHEGVDLRPEHYGRFCMFSIKFSPSGRELFGGSSDQAVYLFDFETRRRIARVAAHDDDINSVCWADAQGDLLLSAGDDGLCKMWDRRTLGKERRPIGVFVGHCDGLTHVSPKGDGRYCITNSKDQSIKLWDMRRPHSPNPDSIPPMPRRRQWDYRRWNFAAATELARLVHPADHSLMTYRGHTVMQTLIRCHFSPAATTRQKYIYTGSHDGRVVVYDVLTGEKVRVIDCHRALVRDVSWHPSEPFIASTSWDGTIGALKYNPALIQTPAVSVAQ